MSQKLLYMGGVIRFFAFNAATQLKANISASRIHRYPSRLPSSPLVLGFALGLSFSSSYVDTLREYVGA